MKAINWLLFTTLFAAMGCSQESIYEKKTNETYADIINNTDILNTKVTLINSPLQLTEVQPKNSIMSKSLKVAPQYSLIAQIKSPTYHGRLLSASCVKLVSHGNLRIAFVTYNLQGAEYSGALQVVDASNAVQPIIKYEMYFGGVDINTIEISESGDLIWLGGSSQKKGAVIIPLAINETGVPIATNVQGSATYSAITIGESVASVNGISAGADWLYVTAGKTNGGIWAVNYKKNYTTDGNDHFESAKCGAINGTKSGSIFAAVEGGQEAKLHVYSVGNINEDLIPVIQLGSIYHQNVDEADKYAGKVTATFEQNGKICYISMGANGVVAVNVESGEIVGQTEKGFLKKGNTNAVSLDDNYIYCANGADGLTLAKSITGKEKNEIIYPLYVWDDHLTNASANFVVSDNKLIFVAKGANGGLAIIGK